LNKLALRHVGRDWLDYIASNTMTDFNRRWNTFIWTYELQAIVVAVKDEAPDVKTFTLMPNQLWKGMAPGQYITVKAKVEGEEVQRNYSLSPMDEDGCFTITVKRVAGGKLSPWLHSHVEPGMVLPIEQPQGRFVYRQQSKVLFICAGAGITPCYSMLHELMGRTMRPDMAADQAGHFAPALTADNIEQLLPDFRERDIYLCGPQGFMDKMVGILKDKGYDLDKLDTERFVSHDIHALTPSDFKTAQAEIHFRHLDKHIQLTEADQGRTIMQIAEAHGVPIESGCRQGMCGTCKLTIKEGQVSGNTLGNAVYLCSAHPASNKLVLDA
jgi:ferredoxin-NADP reductase